MVRDLLRWGKEQLAQSDISPVDAELLLAHIFGISRMELHARQIELQPDEMDQIANRYETLIQERMTGRPTQYIIGEAPFRYLVLDVGEGVLIPRPETEVLVDEVLHQLQRFDDPISLVDLGSGTGAIAIAIVTETAGKKDVRAIAVEQSTEAAKWLHQNIAKFDLPIRAVEADVADALEGVKCDVVVANPPYIPQFEPLPDEVERFEPQLALRGGDIAGMQVPLRFVAAGARLLKSGGLIALEHHESQGEAIAAALASDFEQIRIHYDLVNRPRFTTATKK